MLRWLCIRVRSPRCRGCYCEGADQEGSIGGFLWFGAGVMIDLAGLVVGIRHQFLELSHVFPCFGEVERPEVLVEAVVDQVLTPPTCTLSMLK